MKYITKQFLPGLLLLLFVALTGCAPTTFHARRYHQERVKVATTPVKELPVTVKTTPVTEPDGGETSLNTEAPRKQDKNKVKIVNKPEAPVKKTEPLTEVQKPTKKQKESSDRPHYRTSPLDLGHLFKHPEGNKGGVGFSLTSFLLALVSAFLIIGAFFAKFWIFAIVGLVFAIAAIVLGGIGLSRSGKVLAVLGLIIGAVMFLVWMLLIILGIVGIFLIL